MVEKFSKAALREAPFLLLHTIDPMEPFSTVFPSKSPTLHLPYVSNYL
jgi:hypothetical protein